MKSGWVLFIAVLVVVGGAFWWFSGEELPGTTGVPRSLEGIALTDPTNFSYEGTVTFNNPGQTPGKPYFVYILDTGNNKPTSSEIEIDELSFCATPSGANACLVMSTSLESMFANKRVVLQGIKSGNTILVRKMQALGEFDPGRAPSTGRVFITWPQARTLIESCRVSFASQTHALDVQMRLADNSTLYTVEPRIDELFHVLQAAQSKCGTIPVATE